MDIAGEVRYCFRQSRLLSAGSSSSQKPPSVTVILCTNSRPLRSAE